MSLFEWTALFLLFGIVGGLFRLAGMLGGIKGDLSQLKDWCSRHDPGEEGRWSK